MRDYIYCQEVSDVVARVRKPLQPRAQAGGDDLFSFSDRQTPNGPPVTHLGGGRKWTP